MTVFPAFRHTRGLALRGPGLVGLEIPCVVLADWLFWDHSIGLSLALFCALVAGIAVLARPGRRNLPRLIAVVLLLLVGLDPMVEQLDLLSLAFGLATTLLAVDIGASHGLAGWTGRLPAALLKPCRGPYQVVADLLHRRRQASRRRPAPAFAAPWLAWIVPSALLSAFIGLFADANPLIATWLAEIPRPSWPDPVIVLRVSFWIVTLVAVWPLIRARRRGRRLPVRSATRDLPMPPIVPPSLVAALLAPAAILRSLVLFNLLFAFQLTLDGAYLWAGLRLPDGMSYATYAHRGAYPLVITALLAGAFVLLARRPGTPAASRSVSALVLLFIGQNILLVISAMRRLALYVEAYSLTEWRMAAFVWMLLVAVGLALMVLQGALARDNAWLLSRGTLAALAMLYGCCFLDVPSTVASYNVAHCAEMRGSGPALDVDTVLQLGPDAIPAVDRYLLGLMPDMQRERIMSWRGWSASVARRRGLDWRGWSFRNWRLTRYLDRSGVVEPAVPDWPGEDDR